MSNFNNVGTLVRAVIDVYIDVPENFPTVIKYGKLFTNDTITTIITAKDENEVKGKVEFFLENISLFVSDHVDPDLEIDVNHFKDTFDKMVKTAIKNNVDFDVRDGAGEYRCGIKISTMFYDSPITIIEV